MRSAAVFLVLVLASCGGSEAVSAARRGDVAAVAKAIEPDYRAGRLGNDEAARIARAVAENAIESAKGDDAQTRVRELRTCARSLVSAMDDRMKTHDAAGAEAAMALLEIDELSDAAAREWLQDTSDDWRAVGARGLVRERDFEARGKALVDPSGKVRRAAMRASGQTRDARDVPMLLEAARVDPDMMARSEAVRAIARIDVAGGDTAQRLHDLWQNADDALREDIAHAYVSTNIAASGGSEELRMLLAAKHGPGVISAAAYVIMRTGPEGAKLDDETRKSAVAIIVRTIDEAPRRERLLAIAMAPLSNADVRAAVKRAADETNDLESREAALSKLLEVPSEHEAAKRALIAFASPNTEERGAQRSALSNGGVGGEAPDRYAHLARRARLALAADGELAVQGWIEADLKSPDPSTRLLAASALASLHRVARAAPLLADPDAHVRTSAACTVLAAR